MFTGLGFHVKDDFKNISRATLNIKVKQLNFTEDVGRRAAETIDSWMAINTNGKIHELVSPGTLMRQTQSNNYLHLEPKNGTGFICRIANEPDSSHPVVYNPFQGPLGATF